MSKILLIFFIIPYNRILSSAVVVILFTLTSKGQSHGFSKTIRRMLRIECRFEKSKISIFDKMKWAKAKTHIHNRTVDRRRNQVEDNNKVAPPMRCKTIINDCRHSAAHKRHRVFDAEHSTHTTTRFVCLCVCAAIDSSHIMILPLQLYTIRYLIWCMTMTSIFIVLCTIRHSDRYAE